MLIVNALHHLILNDVYVLNTIHLFFVGFILYINDLNMHSSRYDYFNSERLLEYKLNRIAQILIFVCAILIIIKPTYSMFIVESLKIESVGLWLLFALIGIFELLSIFILLVKIIATILFLSITINTYSDTNRD